MAVYPRPSTLESFISGAALLSCALLLPLSGCGAPPSAADAKKGGDSPVRPAGTKAADKGAGNAGPKAPADDGCQRYCFDGVPCGDECLKEGETCDKPEAGSACEASKRKPKTFTSKFRLGPGQGLLRPDVWPHNKAMGDPIDGPFTLEMAFAGDPELADKSKGKLMVTFDTSMGSFECELYEDKTPLTVANFVGLARGVRPYQDPRTMTDPRQREAAKDWVTGKPFYDNTVFHRVIAGFMIQGGDPSATGRGTPGYFIPDEFDPELRHDGPGYLSMANRNPYDKRTQKPKYDGKTGLTVGNTGSAQFFITVAKTQALNDRHSIFGKCPAKVPTEISKVKVQSRPQPNKPFEDVTINKLSFARK